MNRSMSRVHAQAHDARGQRDGAGPLAVARGESTDDSIRSVDVTVQLDVTGVIAFGVPHRCTVGGGIEA